MVGTVLSSKWVDGQVLYQIFIDKEMKLFVPASSLEALSPEPEFTVIDRDEFLRRLLMFKLRHPLSDVLYSYRASRTQFEVYQFRPVFKFLASDRRSLLIADEVGLGKTIEAALIYLELKARSDLPRVLIACPAALREKWRSELKLRFDEDFALLDRRGLQQFLRDYEGTGGLQRLKAIASLETIRDPEFQAAIVEKAVNLDLLVVDEAHHAKNSSSETHKATRLLADRSDNVLLLTATPLQTDTSDLFNLLQMVDAATFSDPLTFAFQLAPNRFVNQAIRALSQVPADLAAARSMVDVLRTFGETSENPVLGLVSESLRSNKPMTVDQIAATKRDLLELNSLSYVFTRTRKRDVQDSAKRTAFTLRVTLTEAERDFYDEMVAQVRHDVRVRGLPAFLVSGRERQAASCLIAARQYLGETYRTKTSDLQQEDSSPDLNGSAEAKVDRAELTRLEDLLALSARIGTNDSKVEALFDHLPEFIASAAGGKILLFAFYRRTIIYLERRLKEAGYTVYVIHGGIGSAARQGIMERFQADEDPAILVSSEVGAEGLDFQFADTLINYDLPWNPMKVEQRIGRIDRYGQASPRVRIVSLVLDDTIETRILERLYARIRIFEESIGDLEPIMGPVISQITAEVLSRDLSPEEENQLAEEMAVRLAHLRQLQEEFEKQSTELMAPDSLFLSDVTAAVDAGRVVSPEEIAVTLTQWVARRFPDSDLRPTEDGAWILRADARLVAYYGDYLARSPEKSDRSIALLHAMQGRLGVPCTFDDQLAQQRRGLHFMHVRHPLVQAAVDYFRSAEPDEVGSMDVRITRIQADAPIDLAGRYTFFINVVRVDAIAPQLRFVCVAFDEAGTARPAVAERLLKWLQSGSRSTTDAIDLEVVKASYDRQHGVMVEERQRIEELANERNVALLEARLINVRRSFAAKITKRREWLQETSEPRIRRMREAEISNLGVQLTERTAELERGRDVRVTYELVTGGVATLVGTLPPTEASDVGSGTRIGPSPDEPTPKPRRASPPRERAARPKPAIPTAPAVPSNALSLADEERDSEGPFQPESAGSVTDSVREQAEIPEVPASGPAASPKPESRGLRRLLGFLRREK